MPTHHKKLCASLHDPDGSFHIQFAGVDKCFNVPGSIENSASLKECGNTEKLHSNNIAIGRVKECLEFLGIRWA
jgi:hypothetical protein